MEPKTPVSGYKFTSSGILIKDEQEVAPVKKSNFLRRMIDRIIKR